MLDGGARLDWCMYHLLRFPGGLGLVFNMGGRIGGGMVGMDAQHHGVLVIKIWYGRDGMANQALFTPTVDCNNHLPTVHGEW